MGAKPTTIRFCLDANAADMAFALTALSHNEIRDFASELFCSLHKESPGKAMAFLTSFRESYIDTGDAPLFSQPARPATAPADGDKA